MGCIRWSNMLPSLVQEKQLKVFQVLLEVSQDPEWVVRYAAVFGLQFLGINASSYQPDLIPQKKTRALLLVLSLRPRLILSR